jgi:hypothetical protein
MGRDEGNLTPVHGRHLSEPLMRLIEIFCDENELQSNHRPIVKKAKFTLG